MSPTIDVTMPSPAITSRQQPNTITRTITPKITDQQIKKTLK